MKDYTGKIVYIGIDVHKKTYSVAVICNNEVIKRDTFNLFIEVAPIKNLTFSINCQLKQFVIKKIYHRKLYFYQNGGKMKKGRQLYGARKHEQ